MTGLGYAQVKEEGDSIAYDTMKQGFVKRYIPVVYGLGYEITREAVEDNLYDSVARDRSQALAFSLRQTKEVVHANILNRAFTAAYAGADGKELCATDHPNVNGGTWQNEPTTAADLSEASLEQACIDIGDYRSDRGMRIQVNPQKLVIPPALEFEAGRILKSILQNDTANNAINVLRVTGKIPGGYVAWNYLTDANAWFVLTDCLKGLQSFQRRPMEFRRDNDFDTENAKFKATERYVPGWTDPRCIYGTPGP